MSSDLIPDDVTIQVLTQAREHIIRKTFEAVKGAPKHAIVHVYNSTSVAQREQVFQKSKEEILKIAVDGAQSLLKELAEADRRKLTSLSTARRASPEPSRNMLSEVCNAVHRCMAADCGEQMRSSTFRVTVEHSMPHVYASQVEYMCKHMLHRENVIVSLHPHNDRGCGVADAEMGISGRRRPY